MSFGDQPHRNHEHGAKAAHTAHHPAPSHKTGSNKTRGTPISVHEDPEREREGQRQLKVRTGIVSEHGRDVGEMRCTGGRKTG